MSGMKKQTFGRMTFIPGTNNGKYPFCNSLVINDDITAVIDPASDESLLRALAAENDVDVIINTHYHEDHFTYNILFPEAALYVHTADAPCFRSLDTLLSAYGITDPEESSTWRQILQESFNYREQEPNRELRDGDLLDFGHTRLRVIHTPGHTPGHCSFYCEAEELLFMSDLDLTAFGPWYGDAVSDIDQTIRSVHRLLEIPARTYVTSHNMGVLTGDITDLAAAYLDVINQREEKITAYLDRPRTLEDIAGQWFIYKKPRQPESFYQFAERGMVKAHLDYLIQKGRAAQEEDHYYLI